MKATRSEVQRNEDETKTKRKATRRRHEDDTKATRSEAQRNEDETKTEQRHEDDTRTTRSEAKRMHMTTADDSNNCDNGLVLLLGLELEKRRIYSSFGTYK